jgi:hypothetical protein
MQVQGVKLRISRLMALAPGVSSVMQSFSLDRPASERTRSASPGSPGRTISLSIDNIGIYIQCSSPAKPRVAAGPQHRLPPAAASPVTPER